MLCWGLPRSPSYWKLNAVTMAAVSSSDALKAVSLTVYAASWCYSSNVAYHTCWLFILENWLHPNWMALKSKSFIYILLKQQMTLVHFINSMAADDLVTYITTPSAGMILAYFIRNIHLNIAIFKQPHCYSTLAIYYICQWQLSVLLYWYVPVFLLLYSIKPLLYSTQPYISFGIALSNPRAPSQYKDCLIYVWRFPC